MVSQQYLYCARFYTYKKEINTAIRDIYKRYDSFVQRGSGWVLKKVSKFSVSIMKFKLFQGGCLSALLPRELRKKRCCVSIKNIPKNNVSFTVLRLLCVKILLRRISIGRVTNMIKLLNCYHLTTWKVQYQYEK